MFKENIIYSDGNGEVLYSVLYTISTIFNSNGADTIFIQILKLLGVVALFWAIGFVVSRKLPRAKHIGLFVFSFLLVGITFLPKTTIWIKDLASHNAPQGRFERHVENVPFGFVVLPATLPARDLLENENK